MTHGIILDGTATAKALQTKLITRVEKIKTRLGYTPILATILVGSDPASATYVRMKGNACRRVGLESRLVELPEHTSTDELKEAISTLNKEKQVHGILLQHPVPHHINERECFDTIAIEKDVDGVTTHGFGRMAMGEKAFGSATPAGIMRLLDAYDIPLEGKHAVVVGRSPILGKPMSAMLLNQNCTVTVCHSRTKDLPFHVGQADLIVGAVGRPEFIKASWIKDNAIVVDAGYHPEGKKGDIELGPLADRCAAWTPVPGGVGPMTIITLIANTVEAAECS